MHTDASYWDHQAGCFHERTADGMDVADALEDLDPDLHVQVEDPRDGVTPPGYLARQGGQEGEHNPLKLRDRVLDVNDKPLPGSFYPRSLKRGPVVGKRRRVEPSRQLLELDGLVE